MARHEASVVGRQSELAALHRFLDGLRDGEAAFVLAGPPGIGKTTLWQAGLHAAEERGCRVLAARPAQVEATLSYAGLVDLLGTVDEETLERLPAPQRRALEVALLRREAAAGAVDARAVATAVATLLRGLAEEAPTVVAVDDAQWLDDATAAALRFALRRLGDAPLGVLASVRVEDGRRDTFEREVTPERHVELDLTPLSVAALHEVALGELGWSPPRPMLVQVAQQSGGNAFYALEIMRELQRLGATAAAPLPVPADVRRLVRARVERLPRPARAALLEAAALAVPTTAILDEEALAPAEDAGLVRVEPDGRVRFAHPLVGAAVYDAAGPAARRAAHRALASRLDDPEERARHLALAAEERDERLARTLADAAAHAAARGASASAAELGLLALEATASGDASLVAARTLAAAHFLLDAGDTGRARQVLEACDAAAVEGDLRADLLRELGSILWFEREFDRGYALVVEALAHARDPEVAAKTHRAAAWLAQERDPARAIEHAAAALRLLDAEAAPGPWSWVLLHLAYLRLVAGLGADHDAYRMGRAVQERGVDWDDVSPVLGMWPLFCDDFADARRFYDDGLERSRAEGDETSVQGTLLRLAEIACWTGDWAEADRLAAEGMELADRIGSSAYLGSALYARGLVDAHLGRVEAARAAAERIVALFPAAEVQAVLGHWLLGFLALSLGDAAAADVHYARAAAIVEELGQREPARFRFHPDQAEAVVELGDLERAERLVTELERRTDVFPRPWILATSARCRALLLAAHGDLDAALAEVDVSRREHARLDMPFEEARTLLVEGRILRRLKQRRRARETLEEARAAFTRLGAPLWVARADEELARAATRRAQPGLTETELRIARLAADGLSNPEIAGRMFVSRKTVEANLARAYRKLGISSRAQLARALDREDGGR